MNRKSPDLFLRKSRFLSGKSPFFTILTGKSPPLWGLIIFIGGHQHFLLGNHHFYWTHRKFYRGNHHFY
jgi:hypothetical protein